MTFLWLRWRTRLSWRYRESSGVKLLKAPSGGLYPTHFWAKRHVPHGLFLIGGYPGGDAPNGIGVQQFVIGEGGFVVHCFGILDPIAHVVPGSGESLCELELTEGAEDAEGAAVVGGVPVEVDGGEDLGGDVTDADGDELAGGEAVFDFEGGGGRGVEKGFEVGGGGGFGSMVLGGEVGVVEGEFFVGELGGAGCDGEVGVAAGGAALGGGGGEGGGVDAEGGAGAAVGADGLVEDVAGAAEAGVEEGLEDGGVEVAGEEAAGDGGAVGEVDAGDGLEDGEGDGEGRWEAGVMGEGLIRWRRLGGWRWIGGWVHGRMLAASRLGRRGLGCRWVRR